MKSTTKKVFYLEAFDLYSWNNVRNFKDQYYIEKNVIFTNLFANNTIKSTFDIIEEEKEIFFNEAPLKRNYRKWSNMSATAIWSLRTEKQNLLQMIWYNNGCGQGFKNFYHCDRLLEGLCIQSYIILFSATTITG